MELVKQRQYTLQRAAAIAVLFVGAVAARIFWISQTRALWGDETFYSWLSATPNSPLLSASVTLIERVLTLLGFSGAPAAQLSTLLLYAGCGGLLVAPVYGIARRMGGEAIAAAAGLATVFYPAMVGDLPHAGSLVEPVYLLLVAVAWYLLLTAVDESTLWPAAAGGLFVGLAFLTRTEALGHLAAALILLLVATWMTRKPVFSFDRAVANVIVATITFVLIAGPQLATVMRL
jgi:hypothetical protein